MAFKRGEIIEIQFQLPNPGRGGYSLQKHPAIIISNDDVYASEGCYICVMMTHSTYEDMFTFIASN